MGTRESRCPGRLWARAPTSRTDSAASQPNAEEHGCLCRARAGPPSTPDGGEWWLLALPVPLLCSVGSRWVCRGVKGLLCWLMDIWVLRGENLPFQNTPSHLPPSPPPCQHLHCIKSLLQDGLPHPGWFSPSHGHIPIPRDWQGCRLTIGAAPGPRSPGRRSLQVSLEPGPGPAALLLQRVQDVTDGAHQPSHVGLALREQLRAGDTWGDTELWLNC